MILKNSLLSSVSAVGLLGSALATAAPTAENELPDWKPTGWSGGGLYFSAAFHPTRDGVLFLGMDVAGVAKSTDHGKTFRVVNKGLTNYAMYSLAVDVQDPDVAYAVTEGGLHKSTDGGDSWKFIPKTGKKDLRITAEREKSVRAVAVDSTDSNIVYAASPGGKIYKSTDGAATWRAVYQNGVNAGKTAGMRVQFGGVNGEYFGGFWTPLQFPADASQGDATGFGLTMQGDGTPPEKAFLTLRTSDGIPYHSRDLRDIFSDTGMRDVVFTAGDFEIDPEFAKKSPEKAAAAPKTPDWSKVVRMDFSRVSSPATASSIRISRAFFVIEGENRGAQEFKPDQQLQGYGNMKVGEKAEGTAYSVVVSASDPSRVIAGTEDEGLLLSVDKGETWSALSAPKNAAIASFDPSDPKVIYGAFWKDAVWKSTDAGATWVKSSNGLPSNFSAREIVVNGKDPKEVYLLGSEGWNGGFYYSTDAGGSWVKSISIKADLVNSPTLPGAGAMQNLTAPKNLAVNPLNPKELYIAANWRPCHSLDGGRTWEERVAGADITVQTDIRFSGDRTYVSAMDEGTLVSEDQGKSWKPLWPLKHDWELSGHNWRLAVNNVNGMDRIIATVSPWDGKKSVVIVISEDGGKTFKTSSVGLPAYQITANTMWGRGYPRALAVDPSNPMIVYLGIDGDPTPGQSGGGIFKSLDGGYTWKQLPNQPSSRRMYYGLAVDPTNPKRIIWGGAGTNGGVHISEDGGESWNRVFQQDQFLFNVHVSADGTIYAGGNNLWSSSDHGKTWKQLTKLSGGSVVGIEVDPGDPKTIWYSAVTWDNSSEGGVFKSTDGGTTWTNFTGNIMVSKPQLLRLNPKTRELWAGQTMLHKTKQ